MTKIGTFTNLEGATYDLYGDQETGEFLIDGGPGGTLVELTRDGRNQWEVLQEGGVPAAPAYVALAIDALDALDTHDPYRLRKRLEAIAGGQRLQPLPPDAPTHF